MVYDVNDYSGTTRFTRNHNLVQRAANWIGQIIYAPFFEALEKLKHYPERYPFIKFEYRRILIHKFPYKIVYKLLDQVVLILAIFHQCRNPAELMRRLKT